MSKHCLSTKTHWTIHRPSPCSCGKSFRPCELDGLLVLRFSSSVEVADKCLDQHVQVRAKDWRAALSRAPKPCSLRSALQINPCSYPGLPQDASSGLLHGLAQLLGHCHRCSVPMTAAVQRLAAHAADSCQPSSQQFEQEAARHPEHDMTLLDGLREHLASAHSCNAAVPSPGGSEDSAHGAYSQSMCACWSVHLTCTQGEVSTAPNCTVRRLQAFPDGPTYSQKLFTFSCSTHPVGEAVPSKQMRFGPAENCPSYVLHHIGLERK